MNFKEWLINEKQSAEGNRNRAPGRLLNIGPTRDFTQDFRSPAKTPFWAQITTSLVSAMGGLMNKKLYGRSGIGRPQTPTTFIEPSLWTDEEVRKKTKIWPYSVEIDITNAWNNCCQNGVCTTATPDCIPMKDMSRNERREAEQAIFEWAWKPGGIPEIQEIINVGIEDEETGKMVKGDPRTAELRTKVQGSMPILEIKIKPLRDYYKFPTIDDTNTES